MSVTLPLLDHDAELRRAGAFAHGFSGQARFLARRYPLGTAGLFILIFFILCALFAEWIAPLYPLTTDAKASLAAPSARHWMGAALLGWDEYGRIIHGARIGVMVARPATEQRRLVAAS